MDKLIEALGLYDEELKELVKELELYNASQAELIDMLKKKVGK